MFLPKHRKHQAVRLLVATAYCCTAWERPGESLAELRDSCDRFATENRLRISAWAAEVTPDDSALRYTPLLRYTIEYANDSETDLLIIAESRTLVRSYGAATFLAKTLSPADSRIVALPPTVHYGQ